MDYYERKLMRSGDSMRLCLIRFIGMLFMLIMIMLTGCKTIKSAESHTENNTELKTDSASTETVKKDSTDIQHSTNVTEKEKTHTESHKEQRDSFVTVVDQNGNVIGTKEYHWLRETLREVSERERTLKDSLSMYRHISDSLNYYKEKLDSVSNLSQREKIVEVEKEQSISEKVKTFFANAIVGVILFVLIVVFIKFIKKRLRR